MYNQLCNTPSDINEHLPTLAKLASECETITEMGVRYCVSTWAFIEGNPKKLTCIDINHPSHYVPQGGPQAFEKVLVACKDKGIDFEFIQASTLDIEIEPTDLLFIDTEHTYNQLSQELKLHASKAKKYIVLHDTTSCPELWQAVEELKGWKVQERYTNNSGLTVLIPC
jgi:hypothetical protein